MSEVACVWLDGSKSGASVPSIMYLVNMRFLASRLANKSPKSHHGLLQRLTVVACLMAMHFTKTHDRVRCSGRVLSKSQTKKQSAQALWPIESPRRWLQ